MATINALSNAVAPASPSPSSSSSSSRASFATSIKGRASGIAVGLRRTSQRLRDASSFKKPTTLQFHGTRTQADALFEAIFPPGALPKGGFVTARVKATLARLADAALAFEDVTTMHVGVHGAWAEPGPRRLFDPGLAEIMQLLQKIDPPLDIPDETPAQAAAEAFKSLPSLPTPTGLPGVLRPEAPNRERAKACLRRASEKLRLMRTRDNPDWSEQVAEAGIEINLALSNLRNDRSPEAAILRRDAVLCRLEYIVESNENPRIAPNLHKEAMSLTAQLLDRDPTDISAHMARARVYWTNRNVESALSSYLDALQAYQQRNNPSDAPASLDALPMYDDAPSGLYPAIKELLPSDAPAPVRAALTAHIEHLRGLQRMRKDTLVGAGARLCGPLGGSAKSPRPKDARTGAYTQGYTIEAPPNVMLGEGALLCTLRAVHDHTIATGFLSADKQSRVEQVCGFNRMTVRHDGISVEDFDGKTYTRTAADAEFYIADLCKRLAPGVAVTVIPDIQGVRSEAAECYIKYTQTWSSKRAQIKWGGSVYTLPFGSDNVANIANQRRVAAAAVNVIGHARAFASALSYDGQRFAKLSVSAEGLQIRPQFGDVRATPEVRAETRAFIARRLPIGADWKDIAHLYNEIKRFTNLPVETVRPDNVSDALRSSLAGAQAVVADIASLLPDGTLSISEPERSLVRPRPFNKSGYKLWGPETMFRLINEELWVRKVGEPGGWGDQFEAKVLREMGLNVRIWQPQKVYLDNGHVSEAPWRKHHDNVIELQEDDEVVQADDGKPTINILRVGGVHYVTLLDVQNDEDNWRLGIGKKTVDNPGRGDCFFYSVINGAMQVCPDNLPRAVLEAMGSRKTARELAMLALRGELRETAMRLLDTSPKFEEDLYAHLHPDDGYF